MRQIGGCPPPVPPLSPPDGLLARTHASHTSFTTVARGFACKWRRHSLGGERDEVGEGVGWAVPRGRGRPIGERWGECRWERLGDLVQLDELRDGVTHLDGDLHHVPRGRHGPAEPGAYTFQIVQPPNERAAGLKPLGIRGPSVRGLIPVAYTYGPGYHSWPGAAAFPRERRLVPG